MTTNTTKKTELATLPVGFFDDVVEEAKARKIDLGQVDKQQKASEWTEFQSFIEDVDTKASDPQVLQEQAREEEERRKEEEARAELEQMQHMNRYRKALMIVSKAKNEIQQPLDQPELGQELGDLDVADDTSTTDHTGLKEGEIVAQVLAKKRKQQLIQQREKGLHAAQDEDLDAILGGQLWRRPSKKQK